MNWLLPGFLAASGAIVLPIILHFLRSRPKTLVLFPSLHFLGEAAVRDTRRHRLRRWITLALRCLIIALLAAAFARPFWLAADATHRQVMIVAVDNSMSMQAGTRWQDRRQWALDQLAELRPGDAAGILLVNPSPTWLLPISPDLTRVRSTLQDLQPGFEKSHFNAALRLAGDVLSANPAGQKTIIWMSDEQKLGWLDVKLDQPLPPGVNIRFVSVAPAPEREAAITHIQRDTSGISLTVNLAQSGTAHRALTLTSEGKTVATRPLDLIPGENKIAIPLADQSASLRASLDADDFPVAGTAWLARTSTNARPVLTDTVPAAGVDFLAHAIDSTRRLDTAALKPAPLPDSDWPGGGIAILRNSATFQGATLSHLDDFMRAGGNAWIILDGTGSQSAWLAARGVTVTPHTPDPSGDAMHLRDWDPDHPILSVFNGESLLPLMQVEFYAGSDLAGDSLDPIARWPDGKIAIAELDNGRSRLLISGFPLDRAFTDWPVQPSFLPFVHQAVRWLASMSAAQTDFHVGDTIALSGSGTWQVLDSPVKQSPRPVSQSIRPDAPGLYQFTSSAGTTQFAVNFPPEEADLAPFPNPTQLYSLKSRPDTSAHVVASAPLQVSDEIAESQQRLWWWLLVICAIFIFAELAIANRTAA